MVTRIQVEENRARLRVIWEKIEELMILHDTALFAYKVNSVIKYLPTADIEVMITEYLEKKNELQLLIGELL